MMAEDAPQAESCRQLLAEYRQKARPATNTRKLRFGGVRIDVDADTGRIRSWQMPFLRGRSLTELAEFAHGPPQTGSSSAESR